MDEIAIRVDRLGKSYLIGHLSATRQNETFRDTLSGLGQRAWRSISDLARGRPILVGDEVEEFWALKDVSFEVPRGQAIGIVGRNGAGKSTLLKVLSRITEPSRGRIEIQGTVASLLEVGTGFHPELTGRENIFLNGAILGMSQKEIRSRFDEIVQFAHVERFLDTPVKRYSSGMYVRLAFAVAVHLQPDILIIDEVLAVGDAGFQRRCLEKITEITESGKTIIFVSHNLQSVLALCSNALWLDDGSPRLFGPVQDVVSAYSSASLETGSKGRVSKASVAKAWIERFNHQLVTDHSPTNPCKQELKFEIDIQSDVRLVDCSIQIGIRDHLEQKIAHLSSFLVDDTIELKPGMNRVTCCVPELPLYPGVYHAHVALVEGSMVIHSVINATTIDLSHLLHFQTMRTPDYGPVVLKQNWHTSHDQ